MEWMIERVPSDVKLNVRFSEWKALRKEGWKITVLECHVQSKRGRKTVSLIAFGYRP